MGREVSKVGGWEGSLMEIKWEILRRKWATLPNLTDGSSKMNPTISIGFDNMVVVDYLDHCDPNGRIKACWNLEVRLWTVIWGNSFEEFCYKEQQVELGTRVGWKIKEGQCFGVGAGQHVCWCGWPRRERKIDGAEKPPAVTRREGSRALWRVGFRHSRSFITREKAEGTSQTETLLGWQLK